MSETPSWLAEARCAARSLMDLGLLQRHLASLGGEALAVEFCEIETQLRQSADPLAEEIAFWRCSYSRFAHLLAPEDRWLTREVRLLQHALSDQPDGLVAQQAWEQLDRLRPAGGLLIRRRSNQPEALLRAVHTSRAVLALASHPDGRRLFSAAADGKIHVWDGETGSCLKQLEGHAAAVRAMVVQPPYLVSAAADGMIKLWDLADGSRIAAVAAHDAAINAVSALGSEEIASAGEDGAVRIWRVPSLERMAELGQGKICLRAVAGFPDGRILAGGGVESEAVLWAGRGDGTPVVNLRGPQAAITGITVHPNTNAVASCQDGSLYLWDGQGTVTQRIPSGHNSHVLVVAGIPEKSQILSAGRDGRLCCVDTTSMKILGEVGRHTGPVTAVVAPRKGIAVSGGQDGMIAWWNSRPYPNRGHAGPVHHLVANASLGLLFSGGEDGHLLCWDAQVCTPVRSMQTASSGVTALAEGPGEIFVGHEAGNLVACSLADPGNVKEIGRHDAAIAALVIDPATQQLVSAGWDAKVRVWARGGSAWRARILTGHQGCILALAVDGQRDLVLSGGWGREVLAHSLSRGELRGRVRGHRHPIVALTICGPTLVSADEGGEIGFAALDRLEALETKSGHSGSVTALHASPDHAVMLSGSSDGRVGIWAVPERKRTHLVDCGRGPIRGLSASADGVWGAVTSDDGSVRVLSLTSGEIVASWLAGSGTTACRWLGQSIACGTRSGQMLLLNFLVPRVILAVSWHPIRSLVAAIDNHGRTTIAEWHAGSAYLEPLAEQMFAVTGTPRLAWSSCGQALRITHEGGSVIADAASLAPMVDPANGWLAPALASPDGQWQVKPGTAELRPTTTRQKAG